MNPEATNGEFALHAPAATAFGRIDRYRARYNRRAFPRHAHGYYAFAAIESGGERIFARGREHLVAPGAAVLLNPGDIHTGAAVDARGWSYAMLVIEEEQMSALAKAATGRATLPLFTESVAVDAALVSVIARSVRASAAGDPLVLEESLIDLARLLAGRHGGTPHIPQGGDDGPLGRIRDHLHAHATERIRLADLAHVSGLSRGYLVGAFARRHGLPPAAYLFQIRLARARRLLIDGSLTLADVAVACGFYDQSDFSRHFQRCHGISPGRFRRQMNIRQELPA